MPGREKLWSEPILDRCMSSGTFILPSDNFYILKYGLVGHGVLVPYKVLLTHVDSYRPYHGVLFLTVLLLGDKIDDVFDIPAVMGCLDRLFPYRDFHRSRFQLLRFRFRIRGVHVKVEIGYYEHVIPEFLLVVFLEMDLRIYGFHYIDHSLGLSVPLLPVGNGFYVFYHLLYIPAVFRNLMENSVKYGGREIKIHVECYAKGDGYCHFSYYDTGKGVPEEHLSKIFERFYRVSEGRTRDDGGSGLGLSIVRNAIAFHKGDVRALNRKGGGLEFIFSLSEK